MLSAPGQSLSPKLQDHYVREVAGPEACNRTGKGGDGVDPADVH